MSAMQRSREALESLRTIPLFAEVSDTDLEAIALLLIERRFPKHKTIVEEGLPGDYMYVIREGQVKVTKLSGDGREKILELFGPGSFFGEMSLLDNSPRSASVKTLAETRILALSRSDFLGVLRRSPDIAMAVIKELTRRVRQVDEHASSLSFQRVKQRTQGLLQRLAKDDAPRERVAHHAGAHAPADRRHGRHLARDRDARGEGSQGAGLAPARGQEVPGAAGEEA